MNYTVCFKKACGTLKIDQFYCRFSVRGLVEDMAKEKVIPKGAKLLWVAKSYNGAVHEIELKDVVQWNVRGPMFKGATDKDA
jgi:hypothetical protein